MKHYIVTLRYQFPAWDERDGLPYEVDADSKAQAIQIARREAEHDGNAGTGVLKGRQSWKAVEDESIG
jgi:hypothetical protein